MKTGIVDGRIQLLLVELKSQDRLVLAIDDQPANYKIRRHYHFDPLVRQTVRFRSGGDPVIRSVGLHLDVAEFLGKVQFPQQESQWSAHILAFLQGHAFHSFQFRIVQKDLFAVGNEKFSGRSRIVPTHTSGLTQSQSAGLALPRTTRARICFIKLDFESFGLIVMSFDTLQQGF